MCWHVVQLQLVLSLFMKTVDSFSKNGYLAVSIVCLYKIFTAATPFTIGLFDRHRSADSLLRFPKLYKLSQTSANFNSRVNTHHINIIFCSFKK